MGPCVHSLAIGLDVRALLLHWTPQCLIEAYNIITCAAVATYFLALLTA